MNINKYCKYCARPVARKHCDNCGRDDSSKSGVMNNYNAPVQYNYYSENTGCEEELEEIIDDEPSGDEMEVMENKPHFTEVMTGIGLGLISLGAAATVCGFAAFIAVVVYRIATG